MSVAGAQLVVGQLVVLPTEPALGVGRVERLLDVAGTPHVRLFLYRDGAFLLRPRADVAPCPPGVWPPPDGP